MTKIRTDYLIGPALNWAVRQARYPGSSNEYVEARDNYSTCWNKGGPIIEREGIAIHPSPTWTARYGLTTLAHHGGYRGHFQSIGSTPLIAAMRCFVRSKLGDEVDIPEELLK